jgi:hypothetical protein
MTILKKLKLILLVVLFLVLCGCTTMVTVAPSTTPITEKDTYTKLGYTAGRAYGVVILWFLPLSELNPSLSARDSAIKSGGGNALIEVTEENNVVCLLVVTINWTTVEGTAIQLERKGMEVEN